MKYRTEINHFYSLFNVYLTNEANMMNTKEVKTQKKEGGGANAH